MTKKRLIIAIIIAIAVVAGFVVNRMRNNTEEGVLSLSGNVEVTEANVGFKIPGRIVELLVDEGYKVKAGDVLAKLDSAELTSIVNQNRAALQEATTRLAELKAGSRSQEIEQAKANLSAQEAELVKVKKDFERAEILYGNGAISRAQFDATKSAFDARSALKRSAAELLSLVKEGPRKEQIQAAEQRMQQARAVLTTSEERFRDTVIYAPMAGIVLRKNVEGGETVAAGTPVFTIGDLENPWVKVYVKEDKLGIVKLEQKARVSVDSYEGKAYEGIVTYIASEAEFTPKNVQTQEERVKLVFGVKVRVKNIKDELKPGMPADVRIELK